MRTKSQPDELARRAQRFESLINSHSQLLKSDKVPSVNVLDRLLPLYQDAHKIWAEKQRASADGFNLFEVIEVDGNEACHSKLLAWLLDRRIEHGTHAQGSLGFRLFLEELEYELGEGAKHYADESNYWVHREVSYSESRVDIEIASRKKFIIHIENKIFSSEGKDQTKREWSDLQERAKELGIPETQCHAVFLTLDGSKAQNEHFHSVGWNRIAKVLEKFAVQAQPLEVKLFASHYAKALRKLAVVKHQEKEIEDAQAVVQRTRIMPPT